MVATGENLARENPGPLSHAEMMAGRAALSRSRAGVSARHATLRSHRRRIPPAQPARTQTTLPPCDTPVTPRADSSRAMAQTGDIRPPCDHPITPQADTNRNLAGTQTIRLHNKPESRQPVRHATAESHHGQILRHNQPEPKQPVRRATLKSHRRQIPPKTGRLPDNRQTPPPADNQPRALRRRAGSSARRES